MIKEPTEQEKRVLAIINSKLPEGADIDVFIQGVHLGLELAIEKQNREQPPKNNVSPIILKA